MKTKYTNILWFLLFTVVELATAQQVNRTLAPENPTPLNYLTSHFGYLGPVKTAVNMSFDKTSRITLIKGAPDQTFTYLKDKIIVNKYGNTFHYALNEKNQITGWTIPGSKEKGTYFYDKADNLIEEKSYYNDYTDHLTYTYDAANRLISKTSWVDSTVSRVDNYSYSGEPGNLMVTTEIAGDSSSRVFYYYQNGVLVNYVYDYSGASNMEQVKTDSYGNVISYTDPTYGEDVIIEISYY